MTTTPNDRGAQTLEFALVSPLIAGAAALVMLAASIANTALMTYGVAQSTARQLAINGQAQPPDPYTLQVTPPNPKEGAVFNVTISRPITLPLPGKPTWTIQQTAWGVRAPMP